MKVCQFGIVVVLQIVLEGKRARPKIFIFDNPFAVVYIRGPLKGERLFQFDLEVKLVELIILVMSLLLFILLGILLLLLRDLPHPEDEAGIGGIPIIEVDDMFFNIEC